jgi:hypothetical protein
MVPLVSLSFIGGGTINHIYSEGDCSSIVGGGLNIISGSNNFIGGGSQNCVQYEFSSPTCYSCNVIGGGYQKPHDCKTCIYRRRGVTIPLIALIHFQILLLLVEKVILYVMPHIHL